LNAELLKTLSTKIPNTNQWIKPNQIDYFSLDDFNPDYKKAIEEGADFGEIGDIDFNVSLTLRRALDAFESDIYPFNLKNYSDYKNSQELLELSYQDLNSYVSSLDAQELIEVYGASPWDIYVVENYLKLNNANVIDIDPESRTVEFNISAENFKNAFTKGDLIISQEGEYINKNLNTSDSSLYAQGKFSEMFSEALIGFDINTSFPSTPSNTTKEVSSESNEPISTYFYPQELGSAYNFPELDNSSGGEGVRIGLVGSGGNQAMLGWQQSPQYHQYLRNQGIDPNDVLPVQAIDLTEKNRKDPGEQMLDISVLTSIAPKAQIIASADSDYASLIYDNEIDIISSSVGFPPTFAYNSKKFQELFIDAILRGITVVVASGDQGTANLSSSELFPLGQPLPSVTTGNSAVLSVGGTSFSPELNISPFFDYYDRPMVVDGIAYDSLTGLIDDQSMWNDLSYGGAGYGKTFVGSQYLGVGNQFGSSGKWSSEDFVLHASYQGNLLENKYARKYPDVSVLAAGNHENGTRNRYTYIEYDKSSDSYMFNDTGGTSAGAPLTAGLLAVIAGDLKKQNPDANIGFINPLLYEVYSSDRRDDLFIDVPAGSNNANVFKIVDEANWDGNFFTEFFVDGELTPFPLMGTGPGGSLDTSLSQTGAGFDDASGLGSLNGTELLDYLREINGLM